MSSAQAAFRAEIARLYRDVEPESLVVTDGPDDAAIPGFAALETTVGGHAVRGWARADGPVVLARRQNFGPVLDAIGFREESPALDEDAIAARLAWAHGDDFALVDEVHRGDLGMPRGLQCPPLRERRDDGALVLRFVLRKHGRVGSPAILAFAVAALPDGRYRTDVWQLAPKNPDDDDE